MNDILIVNDGILLTRSSRDDKPALVKYLNDPEIFAQTLRIPYPYSEQDAERMLDFNLGFEEQHKVRKNWVIRNRAGELMGHIGLHYPYGVGSANNELYYWLGKPFRNSGIMSKVLPRFVAYCFEALGINRLEAPVFAFNAGSEKLLIKTGFHLEEELPGHYEKDGRRIDAKMYVKHKGD